MKKLTRTLLMTVGVAALLGSAASCTPVKRGEYAKGTATIACDDGFHTILDEEIEVFEFSYPQSSIIPIYTDEAAAIDSLMNDAVNAIIVTKELTKEQREYIKAKHKRVVKQKPIAVDAVAMIVNKDNPVSSLTLDDIRHIMNGEITKWSQLAVNDTADIKLIFDNAGSSTVAYMRDKFLNGEGSIADKTHSYAQKNNAQVFDVVKKDPNALGIISVSWLGDRLEGAKSVPMDKRMEDYSNQNDTIMPQLTTEVKILKVSNPTEKNDFSPESFLPYQAYIYSGEYPLVRKVYMVSTASNSTVMHSFYTFVTGYVGQKIISLTGILPYQMNPRVVNIVQ